MKHLPCKYYQLGIGILVGAIIVLAGGFWVVKPYVWLGDGCLQVRKFPAWLGSVSFEDRKVTLWVTDYPRQDAELELHFIATCKEHKYGQVIAIPDEDQLVLQYSNLDSPRANRYLNDIRGKYSELQPGKDNAAIPRK